MRGHCLLLLGHAAAGEQTLEESVRRQDRGGGGRWPPLVIPGAIIIRIACFPELAIGSRVKTRPTLIDKLRRTPEIKLPSIRDIAGARLVLPEGGRREQRAVVARVIKTFSGDGRPAEFGLI